MSDPLASVIRSNAFTCRFQSGWSAHLMPVHRRLPAPPAGLHRSSSDTPLVRSAAMVTAPAEADPVPPPRAARRSHDRSPEIGDVGGSQSAARAGRSARRSSRGDRVGAADLTSGGSSVRPEGSGIREKGIGDIGRRRSGGRCGSVCASRARVADERGERGPLPCCGLGCKLRPPTPIPLSTISCISSNLKRLPYSPIGNQSTRWNDFIICLSGKEEDNGKRFGRSPEEAGSCELQERGAGQGREEGRG
jgi:hypothetical protein